MNLLRIQRMKRSCFQPRRGRCRRAERTKENFIPLEPEFHLVDLLHQNLSLLCLLLLPSILLICSSHFVIPFCGRQPAPSLVSAADNADIGQIRQFAPVATASPETKRSPNLQTDDGSKDKYDAAFKRLGQDEYPLTVSVVNSLGECADPVDFFCQSSSDPVVQDSSEICPDY